LQPQLGWVWLSQAERSAAENALNAAGAAGTRDELGFGLIHFAYADRFFPGTSVLHTSIRYAWFICWAYEELAARYPEQPFPLQALYDIEVRTGRKLLAHYGHGDGHGIIGGRVLRAQRIPATKPSRIYWNALRTWGLLAPLPRTGQPPGQGELHGSWPELTDGRQKPEIDWKKSAPRLFVDPPPAPADWRRPGAAMDFDLTPLEAERLRVALTATQAPGGGPSLMARLAGRRKPAPAALTDAAVRRLCSEEEAASLVRARQAGALVCLGRGLYAAMVEDMKRRDGVGGSQAGKALGEALETQRDQALALDLDALERDAPLLGGLKPLLADIRDWAGRGGAYDGLVAKFRAREFELKDDRGLLLPGPAADARRETWRPPYPRPLTYRWERVAHFMDELAP
jgi:hypothetical protein